MTLRILALCSAGILLAATSNATVLRTGTFTTDMQPTAPIHTQQYGSCTYNLVEVIFEAAEGELGDRCSLYCFGGGEACCDFQSAAPPDCDGMMDLYADAHCDDMVNHAENEIAVGNNSGTWNSNIVVSGLTYYRTIVWSYNPTTGKRNHELSVTETN